MSSARARSGRLSSAHFERGSDSSHPATIRRRTIGATLQSAAIDPIEPQLWKLRQNLGSEQMPPLLHFEDFEVGSSLVAGGYEVSKDEIVSFAKQWDPQPWHVDEVAAARSPMQGITASSVHIYAIAALLLNRMRPVAGIASLRHELELPNPTRPGDVLTLTMTCSDKRRSKSKPDRGLLTFDSVLANQTGVVVLKLRSLMMVKTRSDPAAGAS